MEEMILNAGFGLLAGGLLATIGYLKSYTQAKEVFVWPKFALTTIIGMFAGVGVTMFGIAPEQAVTLIASLAGVTVIGQDVLKTGLALYLVKK
jgi:hypothetical protein